MTSSSPSTTPGAPTSLEFTPLFTSVPSSSSSSIASGLASEPSINRQAQTGQAMSPGSSTAESASTPLQPSSFPVGTMQKEAIMTAAPAQTTVTVKQEDGAHADGMPPLEDILSSHKHGQTPEASEQKVGGKKKGAREKRVLPTRLRRLPPLWAESELDEHLWSASESAGPHHLVPESAIFILSSNPMHFEQATESVAESSTSGALDFFADPEVIRACREKALIETPEFKIRDDSTQMGKTRGGALRSEEDTSDAAYERRHRRGDNAEKRSRRMEKERLVRDRQKIRDRIEQYKMADVFQIMALHASRARPSSSVGAPPQGGDEGSSTAPNDHNMSTDAAEMYRAALIEDATERLARYDALLTEVVPSAQQNGKKEDAEPSTGLAKASSSTRATDHVETPLRRKSQPSSTAVAGERASPRSTPIVRIRRPRASEPGPSTPSASSPVQAGSPTVGEVKAELSRPNIHARTAGGRFAKKSAIGTVVSEAPRGKRTSSAGSPEARSPPGPSATHKPRGLRPSELARKAAREEEKARAPGTAGSPSYGSPSSMASTMPRASSASTRAMSRHDSPPEASVAAAEFEHRRRSNRTGPSLAELEGSERKPKKLRLTLTRRPSDTSGGQSGNGPPKVADSNSHGGEEEASVPASRLPDATTAKFSAPKELSMQEAQEMMMRAMMNKGVGGAELLMKSFMQNASKPVEEESTNASEKDVEMADETKDSVVVKTEDPTHPQTGTDFQMASQSERDVSADDTSQAKALPLEGTSSSSPSSPQHPLGTPLAGVASTSEARIPLPTTTTTTTSDKAAVSSESTFAHFPGRTIAARQRAAADIPLRRASGRVAELAKGAFGERVPARALVREDFDRALMQARYEWSVTIRDDAGESESESGSEESGQEDEGEDEQTSLLDVDVKTSGTDAVSAVTVE